MVCAPVGPTAAIRRRILDGQLVPKPVIMSFTLGKPGLRADDDATEAVAIPPAKTINAATGDRLFR